MSNNLTFEDFKQIFADYLGVDIKKLHENTSIMTELGIDSLSLVNFIIKVERKYGVKFSTETGFMLKTLGEAYKVFSKALNEKELQSI